MRFFDHNEAEQAWREDQRRFEALGVINPGAVSYLPEGWRSNIGLAMDALPTLFTAPNSGIPAYLTTLVDPTAYEVLFSANKGAKILGEVKKGTWVDETALFTVVEHNGEVSAYGDYNENGRAGANTNWPQRQSFLFQTVKEYGERELERAGLAKLDWVAQIEKGANLALDKYMNLTYHFGVAGLQNYGILNDPSLSSAISPAPKAAGNGNRWMYNGQINATANEIYADIQALFAKLVSQSGGLIEKDVEMKMVLGTDAAVALTAVNAFNVSVQDLLQKNFPNLTFETDVLYNAKSASNPQGSAVGNIAQLICKSVEGQETGFCAFNEKARSHPLIRALSSFKQKVTAGTWGAVIRQPFAIGTMVGL
jgi:hypothetical protein